MLVDWLYRTTLEMSLLIGLVLLLRRIVRRTLGARVAYWLWFIPLIRAVLVDRPEWPRTLVEIVGVPSGELSITVYPSPDIFVLPAAVPWDRLWLVGALSWLALRVVGAIRFRGLLAAHSTDIELPAALSALIPPRLQRRGPRYFATDVPGTPFVTGFVRPLVYLPSDFFQRFSTEEQKWIVQHELTHAARGDLWAQTIWESLRAVFWFNPIVHIAAGAVRDDQELACDQVVLSSGSNEDRYSYGKALLVGAGAYLVPPLLSFFGKQRERIAMIKSHKASLRRDVVGVGLCALVGLFMLTKAPVSVAQLVSQDPITVSFRSIPVAKVVQMIADFGIKGPVTGLEQLGDVTANVQIKGVPARDALQGILNCAGFTYRENADSLAIVPSEAKDKAAAACSSVGMQLVPAGAAGEPVAGRSPSDASTRQMAAQHAAEAKDPSWAAPMEARILSQLSQSTGLAVSSVDVDCRQTICRIRLIQPGPQSSPAQLGPLLDTLGFEHRIAFSPAEVDGSPATMAYLRRSDASPRQ
jgi:beta-lactamase regulating signal transducer with metallopeptidase domain